VKCFTIGCCVEPAPWGLLPVTDDLTDHTRSLSLSAQSWRLAQRRCGPFALITNSGKQSVEMIQITMMALVPKLAT